MSRSRRNVRRVPAPGTPEFADWRANVAEGVRAAKLRRRAAGLLTLSEVAIELALPMGAVRKMFPVIRAGGRCYIRRSMVEKWKIETGGADAA
jgi:hypothetical protein